MATAKAGERANNFNLLRLLLAASVVLAHSPELVDGDRRREVGAILFGEWTTLGVLAVNGFFLLSGYLIAQSWRRSPRLGPYLRKRALRIYPGYLVAALVSSLAVGPTGGNPNYWRTFRVVPFVFSLLTLRMPRTPDAFVTLPYNLVNGALWTIRYEFTCYLGLAALGVLGLLRRRWAVLGITLGLTAWAVGKVEGLVPPVPSRYLLGASDAEIFRLSACFLAGTCFELYADLVEFTRRGLFLAAIFLPIALQHPATGLVALPSLGGYLLLAAGLAPALGGTSAIRREDVSYGLYLYAWPIQQMLIHRWPRIDPTLLSALTLPTALLAGWLSWRYVERPSLRWRRGE